MSDQKQDEREIILSEREKIIRGQRFASFDDKECLEIIINRLRAANAALKGKVGTFELWMDTASKSGFVFATGRDGFEITHDPPLCREILAIRVEDAEQQIAALTKERDEARAERDRLREFAQAIMVGWPEEAGCDGFEVQDAAEATGLLVKQQMTARCGEKCHCASLGADFPTDCYRKTVLLTGATLEDEAPPEPNAKGVSAEWLHCGCWSDRVGMDGPCMDSFHTLKWNQRPGTGDPANANPGEAPEPQFTDRERETFQRAFELGAGAPGCKQSYFQASVSEIEAAMLSAGLRPKQRESVTMDHLRSAKARARQEYMDTEPLRNISPEEDDKLMDEAGIRAVLDAVRASDGTMKGVED